MTTVTIAEIAGLHVGTVEACSVAEIKVALESDAPQATAFNTGQPQGFPRLNGYRRGLAWMKPFEEPSPVCVAAQTPVSASATIDAILQHAFVADHDWYFDLRDKECLTSPEWPAAVRVVVSRGRGRARTACSGYSAGRARRSLPGIGRPWRARKDYLVSSGSGSMRLCLARHF
jgi:hypothetical protein